MLTMIHKMIHKGNGILTDRLFKRKWLFYFINWQLRMPCYIINGVNIKLCSHCPCLAPRFVPVSKTGMNWDRTEVLPWQTGRNRYKPGSLRGCIKMFNTTGRTGRDVKNRVKPRRRNRPGTRP